MSFKIRPYNISDCVEILEIINYNILNSTALYDYNIRKLEHQQQIFDDKITKKYPVIVAESNGLIVGFAMYSEFRFRDAYLFTVEHSVYVSTDFQGQGFGKLLLEELILLAKAQKMHTMIGVIDSENKHSIAFHEQFGFKIVGIIPETGFKFDRWLNSVFMQLIL